jgi:hypothetical protein
MVKSLEDTFNQFSPGHSHPDGIFSLDDRVRAEIQEEIQIHIESSIENLKVLQ